jgi:hypothetical protein
MFKRISLNIPEDSYEKLASLSDFYNQDVKNAIVGILDLVGQQHQRIINLGKEYKVPVKLNTIISHALFTGFNSTYLLFNKILENLEVKGLYTLSDLDIDLDEDYMWFHYVALVGCNLQIDEFSVILKPGLRILRTVSHIEVEKVSNKILRKLKKIAPKVELPEEFHELDDYNIEIQEDEEFWRIEIDCTAESLVYLPSVNRISEFVVQLFKKAGVK